MFVRVEEGAFECEHLAMAACRNKVTVMRLCLRKDFVM